MKHIILVSMMLVSFSLDASNKAGKLFTGAYAEIVRALARERFAYDGVVKGVKSIEEKRKRIAMLESFVASVTCTKKLEDHEYIKRFKAQEEIKRLQAEIHADVQDLRWKKLQDLGNAFGQTKNAFKQKGIPVFDYDRVMGKEYRRLHVEAFKPELK